MEVRGNKDSVPIWEKYILSINEAAEYFNIGEKKLRKLADDYFDQGFVLMNAGRKMIKRKRFEEFINDTNTI